MLNRPVVVLDGWSSKFHKLPAAVLMISTERFERDPEAAVEQARTIHARQPEIAELFVAARASNIAFARDVERTLEVKGLRPAGAAGGPPGSRG